jgi:hypothetical protein
MTKGEGMKTALNDSLQAIEALATILRHDLERVRSFNDLRVARIALSLDKAHQALDKASSALSELANVQTALAPDAPPPSRRGGHRPRRKK